jgi:hypothetical protein
VKQIPAMSRVLLLFLLLISTIASATPPSIVLMREVQDCEESVIGTVCGVPWEQAHEALKKQGTPNSLESPIRGNPASLKAAIERLGFRTTETGLTPVLSGSAPADRTIMLFHVPGSPYLKQHWAVWGGLRPDGKHMVYMGDREAPHVYNAANFCTYLTGGWPNCVFRVDAPTTPKPRENWWKRLLRWLGLRRG